MTRSPQAVFREARTDIRNAINAALQKIKAETGLSPSQVSIYVEMISTGPSFGRDEELLLGQVDVEFKV